MQPQGIPATPNRGPLSTGSMLDNRGTMHLRSSDFGGWSETTYPWNRCHSFCVWRSAGRAFGLVPLSSRPGGFVDTVAGLRILPFSAVKPVAWAVITGELATGLLYLSGAWPEAATVLAAILFGAMSIAIALTLARGTTVVCHCFGAADDAELSVWTLGRSLLLLGSAAVVGTAGGQAIPASDLPVLAFDAMAAVALIGYCRSRPELGRRRDPRSRLAPAVYEARFPRPLSQSLPV